MSACFLLNRAFGIQFSLGWPEREKTKFIWYYNMKTSTCLNKQYHAQVRKTEGQYLFHVCKWYQFMSQLLKNLLVQKQTKLLTIQFGFHSDKGWNEDINFIKELIAYLSKRKSYTAISTSQQHRTTSIKAFSSHSLEANFQTPNRMNESAILCLFTNTDRVLIRGTLSIYTILNVWRVPQ